MEKTSPSRTEASNLPRASVLLIEPGPLRRYPNHSEMAFSTSGRSLSAIHLAVVRVKVRVRVRIRVWVRLGLGLEIGLGLE